MHLLRAYILAVGYDYVMLLEKNSHLDATTTLLGNAERGKVMLSSLKTRQEGTYRFFGNSNNSDLIVLLLYNPGATVTLLASPLACEQEIPQITALLNEAIQHPHGCRVTLAQTVIQTSDCLLTQAFVQTGFSKLAVLHFLEQTKHAKQIKIPSGLSFTPPDVSPIPPDFPEAVCSSVCSQRRIAKCEISGMLLYNNPVGSCRLRMRNSSDFLAQRS